MAENNLRQAMVPVGATVIPQTRGTAPGLICPVGRRHGKVIYAVPGVPHEMRTCSSGPCCPTCSPAPASRVIVSRVLRTWGESESGLNARLDDVIARLDVAGDPTLAFLARGWNGLKIRLTANGRRRRGRRRRCCARGRRSPRAPRQLVFGVDDDSMESVVLDLLRERGLTLGPRRVASPAGWSSARLTGISGASDVLRGAIVSYASEVKFDLLGVPRRSGGQRGGGAGDGRRRPAGARRRRGLALTGVAGPRTRRTNRSARCASAVTGPDIRRATTLRLGDGDRQQIREMSVINALDLLRRTLLP